MCLQLGKRMLIVLDTLSFNCNLELLPNDQDFQTRTRDPSNASR
jgi:hypothetical protein